MSRLLGFDNLHPGEMPATRFWPGRRTRRQGRSEDVDFSTRRSAKASTAAHEVDVEDRSPAAWMEPCAALKVAGRRPTSVRRVRLWRVRVRW